MKTGLNINCKQTAGLPRLFLTMFVLTPHITRGSESILGRLSNGSRLSPARRHSNAR